MVQIIAKEMKKANVGVDVKVYPGKSLFKPKAQWNAMVKGQLDISAFHPLGDTEHVRSDVYITLILIFPAAGTLPNTNSRLCNPI